MKEAAGLRIVAKGEVMASTPNCSTPVPGDTGLHSYPCINFGKVQHEGKWYCGVHDPVRRAQARLARKARAALAMAYAK